MQHPQFVHGITCEPVRVSGSEKEIVNAARVSFGRRGEGELTEKDKNLIRDLMREGHGTPFEYPEIIWYVEVPLMIHAQIAKYRISTINTRSGRYSKFQPVFYIPPACRPIRQEGKPMDYIMVQDKTAAESKARIDFVENLKSSNIAWAQQYYAALDAGIAREVARFGAPHNLMTQAYVKMNLRSTLHFIDQRHHAPEDGFTSHGQYEIDLVAQEMMKTLESHFPTVMEAFYAQKKGEL